MTDVVLSRIAAVLDPEYVAGLDRLTLDDVRARRAECQALEEVLSYVRRIVQARLDIVHAELDHRSGDRDADPTGPTADLVADLPRILGEPGRGGGAGRLATFRSPAEASAELVAEVDRVVGVDTMARLGELDTDRVEWIVGTLAELERRISDGRRSLHQHLDAIQAEIVRRYKSGDASVDSLLTSD